MLRFESIPAYYAACGIRGITRVTLDHLFEGVGRDVDAFNRLLSNPARLFESTFPTGGRLGTRANEISESFRDRRAITDLHPLWVVAPVVALAVTTSVLKMNVAGRSFVMTGAGPAPRGELAAQIKAAGGIIHESVSAKTDYLIMADKTSVTSKAKKAQSAGTKLLSYDEVF